MDAEDRDIAARVAENGWTAIGVEDYEPSFVYTIGLMYSTRHPEIIIFLRIRTTLYSRSSSNLFRAASLLPLQGDTRTRSMACP
jgi:hypothetical protein